MICLSQTIECALNGNAILVLGGAGSYKTSIMNLLYNHNCTMDSIQKPFTTCASTDRCSVNVVAMFSEPCERYLIDTPGIDDTFDQDTMYVKPIRNLQKLIVNFKVTDLLVTESSHSVYFKELVDKLDETGLLDIKNIFFVGVGLKKTEADMQDKEEMAQNISNKFPKAKITHVTLSTENVHGKDQDADNSRAKMLFQLKSLFQLKEIDKELVSIFSLTKAIEYIDAFLNEVEFPFEIPGKALLQMVKKGEDISKQYKLPTTTTIISDQQDITDYAHRLIENVSERFAAVYLNEIRKKQQSLNFYITLLATALALALTLIFFLFCTQSRRSSAASSPLVNHNDAQ